MHAGNCNCETFNLKLTLWIHCFGATIKDVKWTNLYTYKELSKFLIGVTLHALATSKDYQLIPCQLLLQFKPNDQFGAERESKILELKQHNYVTPFSLVENNDNLHKP